jgi:hypothetical protein
MRCTTAPGTKLVTEKRWDLTMFSHGAKKCQVSETMIYEVLGGELNSCTGILMSGRDYRPAWRPKIETVGTLRS